jgi:FMN reductase
MTRRPLIVGIGGTLRPGSSTERALRLCLRRAEEGGAATECLAGPALKLPLFAPGDAQRSEAAARLVEAVGNADGLVIASPGYHGSISGLVKNALDYTEDLREEGRPYLEGRAVACISSAATWESAVTTLVALRSVVHALSGWPTPIGVAINSRETTFGAEGECSDPEVMDALTLATDQVLEFASSAADAHIEAGAR